MGKKILLLLLVLIAIPLVFAAEIPDQQQTSYDTSFGFVNYPNYEIIEQTFIPTKQTITSVELLLKKLNYVACFSHPYGVIQVKILDENGIIQDSGKVGEEGDSASGYYFYFPDYGYLLNSDFVKIKFPSPKTLTVGKQYTMRIIYTGCATTKGSPSLAILGTSYNSYLNGQAAAKTTTTVKDIGFKTYASTDQPVCKDELTCESNQVVHIYSDCTKKYLETCTGDYACEIGSCLYKYPLMNIAGFNIYKNDNYNQPETSFVQNDKAIFYLSTKNVNGKSGSYTTTITMYDANNNLVPLSNNPYAETRSISGLEGDTVQWPVTISSNFKEGSYKVVATVQNCKVPNTCTFEKTFSVGPTCYDKDNDGVTTCQGDCNDNDGSASSYTSCSYNGNACGSFNLCINQCPSLPIEICDGIDNNCNTQIDENNVCSATVYYCDADGDGVISSSVSGTCSNFNCVPTTCLLNQGTDCDDTNNMIKPSALEICDQKDNDCNGKSDELFNFTSDNNNCGGCGILCTNGQVCKNNACSLTFAEDFFKYQQCMIDKTGMDLSFILYNNINKDSKIFNVEKSPYTILKGQIAAITQGFVLCTGAIFVQPELIEIYPTCLKVVTGSGLAMNALYNGHQSCKYIGESSNDELSKNIIAEIGYKLYLYNSYYFLLDAIMAGAIDVSADYQNDKCKYVDNTDFNLLEEVCYTVSNDVLPLEITNVTTKQLGKTDQLKINMIIKNNAGWVYHSSSLGNTYTASPELWLLIRDPSTSCTYLDTNPPTSLSSCYLFSKKLNITSYTQIIEEETILNISNPLYSVATPLTVEIKWFAYDFVVNGWSGSYEYLPEVIASSDFTYILKQNALPIINDIKLNGISYNNLFHEGDNIVIGIEAHDDDDEFLTYVISNSSLTSKSSSQDCTTTWYGSQICYFEIQTKQGDKGNHSFTAMVLDGIAQDSKVINFTLFDNAPKISYPKQNEATDTQNPTLIWSGIVGEQPIQYTINIFKDYDTNLVFTKEISDPDPTNLEKKYTLDDITLEKHKNYFVQIIAVNNNGIELFSEKVMFYVDCYTNDQCGEISTSFYCGLDGNSYQETKTPVCQNPGTLESQCTVETTTAKANSCSYGCENGNCNTLISAPDMTDDSELSYIGDETILDWRVNEVSITSMNLAFEAHPESSIKVKDYSTNKNEGVVAGAVFKQSAGYNGKGAYYFAGNNNPGVITTQELDLSKYTVSLWIKPESVTGFKNFLYMPESKRYFSVSNGICSWTGTFWSCTKKVPVANVWTHIAITSDGNVYQNGVYDGKIKVLPLTGTVVLGDRDQTAYDFKGYLDDVKVYNQLLSPQQIQKLANKQQHIIVPEETLPAQTWTVAATTNNDFEDSETTISNSITLKQGINSFTPLLVSSDGEVANDASNLLLTQLVEPPLKNIIDWRVGATSISALNMPFELHTESGTKSKDYSTNKNDAIITGAVFKQTAGHDGKGAYYFPGNNNAGISSSQQVNLTRYTISLWINPEIILGYKNFLFVPESKRYFSVNKGICSWSGTSWWCTKKIPSANVWTHIAITSDGKVYQNGVYDGTIKTLPLIGTILLGDRDQTAYDFKGYLDDVKIYNRILSPEQIAQLTAGTEDMLVHQETKPNELWSAAVTANNGIKDGSTKLTNTLLIN